jgi:hypothetical protein
MGSLPQLRERKAQSLLNQGFNFQKRLKNQRFVLIQPLNCLLFKYTIFFQKKHEKSKVFI